MRDGDADGCMPQHQRTGIEAAHGGSGVRGRQRQNHPQPGETRCIMMTVGSSTAKKITLQVADVHKPLLSIGRVDDIGFDCMFGKHGGMLADTVTGEGIPLIKRDNLYVMKAWVRQDLNDVKPFGGPT